MDDEPMWAADRVVSPTPCSAITILETANEFAIKGGCITFEVDETIAMETQSSLMDTICLGSKSPLHTQVTFSARNAPDKSSYANGIDVVVQVVLGFIDLMIQKDQDQYHGILEDGLKIDIMDSRRLA
uniref:Uncharacterized protein n=1 Tax=Tanacetum cinerariifolium TaxID=118510 RepID=A0A6L2P4W3_TANCI|nr:hypothetical protein [Tanacetum cinerariifolium]